jgi:transposase
VLGWIRAVNRLVCIAETLRAALNSLAVAAPEWLERNSQTEWLKRYGRRVEDSRLPVCREKRDAYALQVGEDGHQLLSPLYEGDASEWLVRIPAVDTLRQVWLQQFYIQEGKIGW